MLISKSEIRKMGVSWPLLNEMFKPFDRSRAKRTHVFVGDMEGRRYFAGLKVTSGDGLHTFTGANLFLNSNPNPLSHL